MAAKDIIKHQFKKGKTGNPKGRPPVLPPLKEALAMVLNEEKEGVTALEAILKSIRAKAISGDIAAARALLERAYGMPKQDHTITGQLDTNTVMRIEVIPAPIPIATDDILSIEDIEHMKTLKE